VHQIPEGEGGIGGEEPFGMGQDELLGSVEAGVEFLGGLGGLFLFAFDGGSDGGEGDGPGALLGHVLLYFGEYARGGIGGCVGLGFGRVCT
jgi:hypothetical protein